MQNCLVLELRKSCLLELAKSLLSSVILDFEQKKKKQNTFYFLELSLKERMAKSYSARWTKE